MPHQYELMISSSFEYGHRLMHHEGKCKFLHGHHGLVELHINSGGVSEKTGMIVDFSRLKSILKFVLDEMDHKFFVNAEDPFLNNVFYDESFCNIFLASIITTNTDPTAETICKYIYDQIKDKLYDLRVEILETGTDMSLLPGKLVFYETPTNCVTMYF